jgi:hypothetical protein
MTSNTFRQSSRSRKRSKSRSRKGGNGLYNAAAASLLPVGLLIAQQYYKNKNNKRSNKKFKGKRYKSYKNTNLKDPYDSQRP